jgi:type II secretory pathway pseudopilin PulG
VTSTRRAPLGTAARKTGQEGFSVVEVLAAVSLLAIGLLSLAGVFTMALGRMTTATWDILAKEKASETIENMLAARDAGRLPFASINSAGNGGIFLTGQRSLVGPGLDRLIGTADDDGIVDTITRPGPNGIFDGEEGSDDEVVTLSNFTREVVITPVPPGNTLREFRVIIRYRVGGIQRQVTMSSYVSSFTG